MSNIEDLIADVDSDLAEGSGTEKFETVLEKTLTAFDCQVGTIHRLDPEKNLLHIIASRGIPEAIAQKVAVIPVGKGMAGLAAERREPVQVCNLQTDESGDAKPGAKMTQMEGSIALPIFVDGNLKGTLGVAKPIAYEFSDTEIKNLERLGEAIGKHLT